MCSLVKNSLALCSWGEVSGQLSEALGDYYDGAILEVSHKKAFPCTYDRTALLLRAENEGGLNELVVVGLAGSLKEASMACVEFAQRTGFDSIRCHTYRRGEYRFLRSLGLPVDCIEVRPDGEHILQIRF